MFKDSSRPQAVPPQCCGKFRWKGKRLLSEKILSSRADLAIEKDKTISLSFFKDVAGSFSVKQQEIYYYHKRKKKEMECRQSILQEGIKMSHLPLPLLGLTLTDTQDGNTASVKALISFGSKREFCLSLKLRQLHCCLALLRWLFVQGWEELLQFGIFSYRVAWLCKEWCLYFNKVNLPALGLVSGNGLAWCPLQLNALCSSVDRRSD